MKSAVLTLFAAMCLSACTAAPSADATTPANTSTSATPGAAAYFTVPSEQLAHLKLATVSKAAWVATVRTTGTVDWDNDQTTQAITQVSGPITRIAVDTGTRVKAGDPLLYVASADISNAMSAYRKAKNRLDLSRRMLDRSKDLLDHKALSPRDYESRRPTTTTQRPICRPRCRRSASSACRQTTSLRRSNRTRRFDRNWSCVPPSRAQWFRRWCCRASSSRPARPRRLSSATRRRCGYRGTSTTRT